ncbi:LysR substrate-binding domain-containing protein [Flavihumibacter rivuli]|uniref:LysR substrate-binding domain-containing protein n=1 Tax=Flavihumibacter rivuli TaxID=2838156 RepID=UPI001BDE59A9|nr:LysR substrate-binding domain-containing protein [Flavihumibacter rivuli]ULQ55882.1 LysR substrate-binding domain-containing protein [Flavihumibacter rivuli]
MSFDVLTLECFLAVAETGGFTRAAEKVGRTQSAISQQIAKLEGQLGKTLFIRGKQFTLTPEGEILLGYARQIVKLQHEAFDRFREPDLEGEVRFGLPEDFASVFLSEVLTEFSRLHPRILLNIECDLTLNLFERFKKKEFDLVLVKMSRPEDFPNGMDVWSEALEWIGDAAYFEKEADQAIPLVLSPQPCVYRSRAIQSLEQARRKWRIVFSSHSFAGTIAAVQAGMGVTVLPRNMVPDNLPIIRHKKGIPKLDDTHISLLKHDDQNPAVNSFENFVVERLRH